MKNLTYITLLILFYFIGFTANAQLSKTNPQYKTSINWGFGSGCGLNFLVYPPVIKNTLVIGSTEGTSGISDANGNLLYFTDGWQIKNKNKELIESGLLGHGSSTQAVLMLAHPENDSLIYIFTTPSFGSGLEIGLNFNILNKNLDGGKGKIILKNKLLLSPTTEKLVAVNHQNGRDIWIVAHGFSTNSYFAFLLTKEGLQECPIESKVGNLIQGLPNAIIHANSQGYLRFSNNGELLANTVNFAQIIELFQFNLNNGNISNRDTIKLSNNTFGLAFSPNNKNLFIQSYGDSKDSSFLDYYNIETKTLHSLYRIKLGEIQSLQNTLYNEIYVSFNDSFYLGAIKDLDSSPYFVQRGVYLGGYKSNYGLPNFNQSHVHKPSIEYAYTMNCVENSIVFEGRDSFYATNYKWYFKNQKTSETEISLIEEPTYSFPDTGDYMVTYIASKIGRSDTITKLITIYPKIEKDFLGKDTVYCKGEKGNILLQVPEGLHCWHWEDESKTTTFFVDTIGSYSVTITNKAFCVLRDTIRIMENEAVTPVIKHDWDSLYCEQVFASYSWYRNGEIITGETKDRIGMKNTGNYELEGTDIYGCSARSKVKFIAMLSTKEIEQDKVKIFPNPVKKNLTIEVKGEYTIQLYNALGNLILTKRVNDTTILSTESLSNGLYLLKISNKDKIMGIIKIIKQ